MRRIPVLHSVSPGGVTVDRLAACSRHYLDRAAERARDLFGRLQCGQGVGRAVEPDDDLAWPPGAFVGGVGEQDGAGGIVDELCPGVAEHDSEKAAASSAA